MEVFFGMLTFLPFTYINSDFVAPYHNPTRPVGGMGSINFYITFFRYGGIFGMLIFILFCLFGLTLHSLDFRPPTITLLCLW